MKSVPGKMFRELNDSSSSSSTSGGNWKPSAIISFFNCSSSCLISTLSYHLPNIISTAYIARTKTTPSLFFHFGLGSNSIDRHEEQLPGIHSRYEAIQVTTRNTRSATLTFASSPIHHPCSLELTREFVHGHSHE